MNYNESGFNQLTSRRAKYLLLLLQIYDSIIYTDIDTVWKRDPRPFLNGSYDFWAQIAGGIDGQPYVKGYLPYVCTGFLALKSTEKTMELMQIWQSQMFINPNMQDQNVFQKIVYQVMPDFRVLPMKYFPCGKAYFEIMSDPLRDVVVLVHNNFIFGKESKIKRFIEFDLWAPNFESEFLLHICSKVFTVVPVRANTQAS